MNQVRIPEGWQCQTFRLLLYAPVVVFVRVSGHSICFNGGLLLIYSFPLLSSTLHLPLYLYLFLFPLPIELLKAVFYIIDLISNI